MDNQQPWQDSPSEDDSEYLQLFASVCQRLEDAENFQEVLWEIEEDIRILLSTERFTIYRRLPHTPEICSFFKTGEGVTEIRLPLSPASIAGYVAMSQETLCIEDVYDAEALSAIHSELRFDSSYDQSSGFLSQSMIVLPIRVNQTLLGVLQAINRLDGLPFNYDDLARAEQLALAIAKKLQDELQTTPSAYDYLIQQQMITEEEVVLCEELARYNHTNVAYVIMAAKEISREAIGVSLERFYNVPFMGYDPEIRLDCPLLENLNRDYLVKNRWLPIAGDQQRVVILLDDPNDSSRLMEIESVLNAASYELRVGLPNDILRYLGVPLSKLEVDLEPVPAEVEIEEPQVAEVNIDELLGQLENEVSLTFGEGNQANDLVDENAATVVKLVNKVIADSINNGASDIHIEPAKGSTAASVRVRIDGVCRNMLHIPASHIRAAVARIKVMSSLDITENRLPQDGKMAVKMGGKVYELRVATLPTVNGESAVLRVLAAGEPMPMANLNLAPTIFTKIEQLVERPHGVFLVVGPTGSGKTTTLHALLGHINTPERKIWTAEDPVEITQDGLQQVQTRAKIGFDFARALRAFLRADPDVILIGEMRDYETAHIGIEASLTGHLVFSTLHTNSAPETVTRLLDMGLDPINFSDALIGVLAQRLVRTLCKKCKQPYAPSPEELVRLKHYYGEKYWPELNIDESSLQLYRPVGCDNCGGTGYRGRTGVHELLVATPEIKALIHKRANATDVRDTAMTQGLRTLMQDGIYKIVKGNVDFLQVHRIACA